MTKPARPKRVSRAERRNAIFDRKPVGNTTPLERQAIFAAQSRAQREVREAQQRLIAREAKR